MSNQSTTQSLERRLGDWLRARLPFAIAEFVMFGVKQAWACLFGGLLLLGLLVSDAIWDKGWPLARYDALLIYAVALQALFLLLKLETWAEARVIVLFHITGTVMEVFKVDAGSWAYPGAGMAMIGGVPLFSGFMYASVGSYIARVIRIFDMEFSPYPRLWITFALAGAIYVNFFSHHFIADIRVLLFIATLVIFGRTAVWFRIGAHHYWMPMPLAAFLASFFLWVAEVVGTRTATWIYAGTTRDDWVSLAKMGSWYLLLYVSFVTVTLVSRETLKATPRKGAHARNDTN